VKLHILPPSPRAVKVRAVNNYLQLDSEMQVVDFARAEQASDAFASLNPNKRQPVLEDAGWVLWESNAILFYLASKKPEAGLWPSDPRDQADVIRWLSWEGSHWDHAWDIIATERFKKMAFVTSDSGRRTKGLAASPAPPAMRRIAEGETYVRELATVLDTHLRGRKWLVGETLSIADFALGAWMPIAGPAQLPLNDFQEIARWYAGVAALPGWQSSLA